MNLQYNSPLAWSLFVVVLTVFLVVGCASSEPSNPLTVKPVNTETVAPVNTNTLRIKNADLWWRDPYYGEKDSKWDIFVVPPKPDPLDEELKHFEDNWLKWPEKMPPAYKPEREKEKEPKEELPKPKSPKSDPI